MPWSKICFFECRSSEPLHFHRNSLNNALFWKWPLDCLGKCSLKITPLTRVPLAVSGKKSVDNFYKIGKNNLFETNSFILLLCLIHCKYLTTRQIWPLLINFAQKVLSESMYGNWKGVVWIHSWILKWHCLNPFMEIETLWIQTTETVSFL